MLIVAIDGSLLVQLFPLMGLMVHVAGTPPVQRIAEPLENPIADMGYPFTVTTAVYTVDGAMV